MKYEPLTGESTVPPHQQRVIIEKMELDERLANGLTCKAQVPAKGWP